jgi:3D (Asp-Asp-Asp) domain-containing protein
MKALINLLAIVVTLNASAYCETGNPTASGVMPQVGHCAVDKINGQWIPFGTIIKTEDGRVLTVTDRFGDSRNNCLDIFMETEQECWEWGRRYVKCKVELP